MPQPSLKQTTADTMEQLDSLKKERCQLEELLLQTQRENERCEEEVKRWKSYSRSLEKEIEHFAGPNWQQRLDVPPTPQPLTLSHYPSTPLTASRTPNDYLETPLPANARPGTTLNNNGWLGGTPVTAIKSTRIGGGVTGDKFSTPTTTSHRRTQSAVQPVVFPEETDTPRSTEGTDGGKVNKAKRRVSAYMEYEEMVLPALRRSPVARDGKDYGQFGELGAKVEKDRVAAERGHGPRTDQGADDEDRMEKGHTYTDQIIESHQEMEEKGILQQSASQQSAAATEANPSSALEHTLSTSLATQLLAALQTLSEAKLNDTTRQRDEQRRQDLLRGIRKQADGVKGYVQSSEGKAGKRLEEIRELMRMAEVEAAKWREDHVDLVEA